MKQSEIRVGATYRGEAGAARFVRAVFTSNGVRLVRWRREVLNAIQGGVDTLSEFARWAIAEVKETK